MIKKITWGGVIALIGVVAFASSASAATTVVVTPTNTQGWSTADTRPGGAVNFVSDSTAPLGTGALQLTTDLTTTAKAQYLHEASSTASTTPLSGITNLSYYTKQASSTFPQGDPSYQVVAFLTGTSTGFTTLVFEPYQNPLQGPVLPGVWQQWDVSSSTALFWSSRTVACSNGTIVGTPGGPASYTLDQIKTICPQATVAAFGVNVGSNNPGYDVYTDALTFNGTTYDFEVTQPVPPVTGPMNKNECKDGGWKNFTNPTFKNQGQCVSSVANGK